MLERGLFITKTAGEFKSLAKSLKKLQLKKIPVCPK